MRRLLLIIYSFLFALLPLAAQQTSAYNAYIRQYRTMAVEQMYKYGIPASITLAQGLLESRAGQSILATRANNHFGIKVSGSWTGPYVLMTDDAPNEKFRAYKNAAESYEDHSRFLTGNRRYARLFQLSRDDYKGWAKGLKAAGYATSPTYASSLISLIDRYDLHQYDRMKRKDVARLDDDNLSTTTQPQRGQERGVFRCNGTYYVIAQAGDTYDDIARWAGVSARKLRKYNEVPRRATLTEGDVVYLEKKKSQAARRLKGTVHTVAAGESLHTIAQRYGMRLKTLYKLNNLSPSTALNVGDRLRIR